MVEIEYLEKLNDELYEFINSEFNKVEELFKDEDFDNFNLTTFEF